MDRSPIFSLCEVLIRPGTKSVFLVVYGSTDVSPTEHSEIPNTSQPYGFRRQYCGKGIFPRSIRSNSAATKALS